MKTFIAFIFILLAQISSAQTDTARFSFWVGNWNANWYEASAKDSIKAIGENSITRDLNGKVIHEHFKVLSGQNKGYVGESWSVLSNATGIWQQTWVDNQGGYIPLTESKGPNNEPVFEQKFTRNGKEIINRMVFKNIMPDSFTWDWESSTDGGKTFKLSWRIFYERKK